MKEQAQVVVEQLTKSRTFFRRAAYGLGFASLSGPILLLAISFNGGLDRNIFSYTPVLIAAATPTMLLLAFTFVPLALALKRRAQDLKEAVDNDFGFEGVISRRDLFSRHLARKFAVELYGNKPIQLLINTQPITMSPIWILTRLWRSC